MGRKDLSIKRLARKEDNLFDRKVLVNEAGKAQFVAEWNISSSEKASRRVIQANHYRKTEELLEQRKTSSERRRALLRDLLQEEREMYEKELNSIGYALYTTDC